MDYNGGLTMSPIATISHELKNIVRYKESAIRISTYKRYTAQLMGEMDIYEPYEVAILKCFNRMGHFAEFLQLS